MSQNNKDKYNDQHELEKIRMKKMEALIEAQKRKQVVEDKTSSLSQKIDYLLKIVLMPDAFNYLSNLKVKEPQVYQKIFDQLINPEVITNLDYLLSIITKQGGVVGRRIPLDLIIFLERQIKGVKSKIQVVRKDESMDLKNYLMKL